MGYMAEADVDPGFIASAGAVLVTGTHLSRPGVEKVSRRALALPRALATRDRAQARALLEGLDVDYVEVAPFDPPVLAAAVRIGAARLIDNVPLEEAP